MKRSQMINIITEVVVNSRFEHPLDLDSESIAEEFLETIEKAGMSPPGYMKPIPFESDGKQYPLIPGDFPNARGVWCTPGVQEWEPENE
jgi:hypothetical protein